ncbi:MAG TPA: hypothetical protein DEV93_14625 [Chloroflexi bacterium]|nr:hypothetical protein [Chloroflexota bacterium]
MQRRAQRSFAWARHIDASEVPLSELSDARRQGYEWALELADDHKRCSEEPPWRRQLPPLTIEDIADRVARSPASVRGRISSARRTLFGDLSDPAIEKRAQRMHGRKRRACSHPRCDEQLPAAAASNRRYCRHHGSGAERVNRHRQSARTSSV